MDVAEDSSLGCVISVVFFMSIAGGVWVSSHIPQLLDRVPPVHQLNLYIAVS